MKKWKSLRAARAHLVLQEGLDQMGNPERLDDQAHQDDQATTVLRVLQDHLAHRDRPGQPETMESAENQADPHRVLLLSPESQDSQENPARPVYLEKMENPEETDNPVYQARQDPQEHRDHRVHLDSPGSLDLLDNPDLKENVVFARSTVPWMEECSSRTERDVDVKLSSDEGDSSSSYLFILRELILGHISSFATLQWHFKDVYCI